MHRFLFTSALLLPLGAAAEDLFQVYRDAQRYDAAYSAARLALEAGREKLPQGRALILPTLNLTGSATRSRFDIDSNDPAISASFVRSTNAASYTLTLTQPLYRPQNWYQYEQGEFQVRQAEATFSEVLAVRPDDVRSLVNKGVALDLSRRRGGRSAMPAPRHACRQSH